MPGSEYSAEDIINEYESDILTWEQQLTALEEQASGLSLDDDADRRELASTARDLYPDIEAQYRQVSDTRRDVKELEEYIDTVLDNPKKRYEHIPESLRKQERMKEQIEELEEKFYLNEERQEYIVHTLAEETSIDFKYGRITDKPASIDGLLDLPKNKYLQYLERKAVENPKATLGTGIIAAGIGLFALDRARKRWREWKHDS